MSAIEQRLRETVGLDAAALGPCSLARATQRRMKHLGLEDAEEYERLLERSPAAWNDLLDELLVTETWFFRDQEAFEALTRLALGSWLPFHRTSTLRVLSLPCSSGEEAYSAAMALLDSGFPPQRFQVEAFDINSQALVNARRAVYGKNSFRGGDLGFRQRYFRATRAGFALDPLVCDRVHFTQGNLLDAAFDAVRGVYDFVFFRNLLIYFDQPARERALEKIGRLLAPNGVLFVGPAEQTIVLDHGFVSANVPFAFACRRPKERPERTARRLKTQSLLPSTSVALFGSADPVRGQSSSAMAGLSQPGGGGARRLPPEDLERAGRLAGEGRFAEATALCEAHLSNGQACAQAFYLLGVVREAGGHANAIDYFRKALYLEPNHYESLLRMARLASRSGDVAGASNFQRRAERLKARPQPTG